MVSLGIGPAARGINSCKKWLHLRCRSLPLINQLTPNKSLPLSHGALCPFPTLPPVFPELGGILRRTYRPIILWQHSGKDGQCPARVVVRRHEQDALSTKL